MLLCMIDWRGALEIPENVHRWVVCLYASHIIGGPSMTSLHDGHSHRSLRPCRHLPPASISVLGNAVGHGLEILMTVLTEVAWPGPPGGFQSREEKK